VYADGVLSRSIVGSLIFKHSGLPQAPYVDLSKGLIMTTRGAHCGADATIAVPELYENSFHTLFLAKGIVSYRQIISSSLHIRLKGTCSLADRALLNIAG